MWHARIFEDMPEPSQAHKNRARSETGVRLDSMRIRTRRLMFVLLLVISAIAMSSQTVRNFAGYVWMNLHHQRHTVDERLAQYSAAVEQRLGGRFATAGLNYPAQQLAFVSFKDVRRLEVYGRMSPDQPWVFVTEYPILAASGSLGPKLREGDRQVPEGVYRAELLNPNSKFHLSLRLDYPNAFDRQIARSDGRAQLGGDIMIHGGASSIGCLAIGNEGAEDLFVLTALVGKDQVRIIVSPTDFREAAARLPLTEPQWIRDLYANIRVELQQYRRRH
jgi:murein L,D-transpeptidase YafK